MEHLAEPKRFVGLRGTVTPDANDLFKHEFEGVCVGVRNGFLQVRDQEDCIFEVEVSQFTPCVPEIKAIPRKDIIRGIFEHTQTLEVLRTLLSRYDNYWAFGVGVDPVLQEMLETSSELTAFVRKQIPILEKKLEQWAKYLKQHPANKATLI